MARKLLSLALVGLFAGLSAGARLELPPWADPKDFLTPDQLRPGERGVCYSVFKGTKVSKFEVEIVGVLKKWLYDEDLVLVKVLSGPVVERKSGIVAGMSGSPVYVRGKLVGAIAYAWGFQKEPIGGVTPITAMLRGAAGKGGTARLAGLGGHLKERAERFVGAFVKGEPFQLFPTGRPVALQHLPLPLAVSGASPRVLRLLASQFEPLGLAPVVPSGRAEGIRPQPLKPGSAVGVQLMRGDLDYTAAGTVTYVKGQHVLLFGHDALGLGKLELPMTAVLVHDIMPSYASSFKFFSSGPEIGAVTRDSIFTTVGETGRRARTIPVRIEVHNLDRGTGRSYVVEVVNHRDLTPSLVWDATITGGDANFPSLSDGMCRIRYVVETKELGRLEREDVLYSPLSPTLEGGLPLVDFVDTLMNNDFEQAEIKRIDAEMKLWAAKDIARVEGIMVDKKRVEPGEEVTITVTIKPFRGERRERRIVWRIPEEAPPGTVRIGATGGDYAEKLRRSLRILRPRPESLRDLADFMVSLEKGTDLVVEAALPVPSTALRGKVLKAVPRAMADALTMGGKKVPRGAEGVRWVVPTPWVLSGMAVTTITVVKPGRPAKPAPPTREGPPEEEGEGEEEGGSSGHPPLTGALAKVATGLGGGWEGRLLLASANKGEGEREPKEKGKRAEERISWPSPRVKTWRQSEEKEFEAGVGRGCAPSSKGDIRLCGKVEKLADLPARSVWALAEGPSGSIYVGTGNRGKVFRVKEGGEVEEVADLDEFAVLSILPLPDGSLLAGACPSGRIYRLKPGEAPQVLAETGAEYVWRLLPAGEGGKVLALTGKPAGVLEVDTKSGSTRQLWRGGEYSHILSAFREGKRLTLGLGGRGEVATLEGGAVRALFQAKEAEVWGVAPFGKGALLAVTSPGCVVYKIEPEGAFERLADLPDRDAYEAVAWEGSVYVATGGPCGLYRVDPDGAVCRVWRGPQEQLTRLLSTEQGLILGASNGAAVYKLGRGEVEATFDSEVYDTGAASRVTAAEFRASVPKGAKVELMVRTGPTDEPDESWSGWSYPIGPNRVERLSLPEGRFVQYRLVMRGKPGSELKVYSVRISYVTRNRPPEVRLLSPKGGEFLSGTKSVRWRAKDPDGDRLTYEVLVSADGGRTWKPAPASGGKGEGANRTDRTSFSLDTKKLKDGLYLLKVVASDEPSNPASPAKGEAVSEEFVVDNSPPWFEVFESLLKREGKGWTVEALVCDDLSPIVGAFYRVDGKGKWRPAIPDDGVFDSRAEYVRLRLEGLKPGKHSIELKARDAAGNEGSARVEVPIPGAEGGKGKG